MQCRRTDAIVTAISPGGRDMADKRGSKLHADGTPDGHALLGGEEMTQSVCGRPVWADMALPLDLLETWAERGLSTEPLCTACVTRSGIEFKKKQAVAA